MSIRPTSEISDSRAGSSVGDQVSIPFGKGNRLINGYVLMLTDKPEFDPSKQKEIVDIITDSSLVEGKLIKLAYWMKEEYGSTMINALKTVLPIKKNVKPKERRTVILKLDREEGYDRLREYKQKHQLARFRLLEQLLELKELDYSLVINKLNISSATIKILEEQGVMTGLIDFLNDVLWGAPMIVFLLGAHLFLTYKTGFVQRKVFEGIKHSLGRDSSRGDVSVFRGYRGINCSVLPRWRLYWRS